MLNGFILLASTSTNSGANSSANRNDRSDNAENVEGKLNAYIIITI